MNDVQPIKLLLFLIVSVLSLNCLAQDQNPEVEFEKRISEIRKAAQEQVIVAACNTHREKYKTCWGIEESNCEVIVGEIAKFCRESPQAAEILYPAQYTALGNQDVPVYFQCLDVKLVNYALSVGVEPHNEACQ
jgi:hypothetical protein